MKNYTTEKIRNICLLGHGGSGKTTLTEAMLFNSGAIDRMGKVPEGTTTTDYDSEEIKRKFSINTAVVPVEWKNVKMNVIDTPGFFDFIGEVKQGLRVAESAVILVPAKSGVEVGTEKAWEYTTKAKKSKAFLISKLDEENADFNKTLEQIKNQFGKGIVPFQLPIYEGGSFVGIVDVVNKKAYKFGAKSDEATDIPEDLLPTVDEIRESLMEEIAETSEDLMEKYFEGEAFTDEEISTGLGEGIKDGSIIPVFCAGAYNNQGIRQCMDAFCAYMPSPKVYPAVNAKEAGSDNEVELKAEESEALSALVFKTIADPFVGKISLFRVYSGVMKPDTVVYNSASEKNEKISQIFMQRGKKQIQADKLAAGDIGAVAKLSGTNTNDTLCDKSKPVCLEKIEFPIPSISLAVEPKEKGDEEKIGTGLQRLQDEDPTFKVNINKETRQTLISGVGEQHLDVIISKLKSKFGVSVDLTDPRIPYRETIKKKVLKIEGKHKKQSGGHGQYGHVFIDFEPADTEDDSLVFEQKIFGGSVPKQYFPAVEKGLRESIQKGVLAGYPMVNLKATLVDGSYHPVDSSEMAFKVAASLAYKKGIAQANPVLLEPVVHVEVLIPDNYMGDIIGDLNKRRGQIMGMNPKAGGLQEVVAKVPEAEMFKYATDLRSMTQGRGSFIMNFEGYEEVPGNIAEKIVDQAKKETEE